MRPPHRAAAARRGSCSAGGVAGAGDAVVPLGPLSIDGAAGPARSTVNVRASLEELPASSVPVTVKVCVSPSPKGPIVSGLEQDAAAPPSTWQVIVSAPGEENWYVGVASPVVPDGPLVIDVTGAVRSTVTPTGRPRAFPSFKKPVTKSVGLPTGRPFSNWMNTTL